MANFRTWISGLFVLLFIQSTAQETVKPVSITHHLGVTSINITPSGDNQRIIQLKAKPVIVNERKLDLNEASFEVSKTEQVLQIIQITDGAINGLRFDGEKFVLTKGELENVVTEEFIETLDPADLNAFIIFANVLKEADVHFDDAEVVFEPQLKASIKDKWCDQVVIRAGAGRSTSETRCVRASAEFLRTHKDCYKMGECDTSCAWENHACFSTAFFGCTGESCNNLIGVH